MMRHPRDICRAWTGCQDRQVPIDLHGIGVDDFAAEPLGNIDREGGLATRRRPADDNDGLAPQPFAILSATKRWVPPVSIRTKIVFSFALIAC